jgi:hypothetical protein
MRVFLMAAVLTVSCLWAEEAGEAPGSYHKHHISAFLGGSHGHEMNGATVGGSYEYRFNKYLGAAVTAEHLGQDFRENLVVFTAMVHPWKGLVLAAGPGLDRARELEFEAGEATPVGSTIRKMGMMRTGAGYEFEFKHRFTIGPEMAVDFVDGHRVFVYGFSVGVALKKVQ